MCLFFWEEQSKATLLQYLPASPPPPPPRVISSPDPLSSSQLWFIPLASTACAHFVYSHLGLNILLDLLQHELSDRDPESDSYSPLHEFHQMDPPLIHESSFSAANPSSYSLAGIWPFAGAASAAVPGAGLGLRIGGLGGPYDSSDQRDGSAEESTVTDLSDSCLGRKRKDLSLGDDSSKIVSTSTSAVDLNVSNGKRIKAQGCKKGNGKSKAEVEATSEAGGKSGPSGKPPEPPKDYIHVRARRGQATDSHSLAERARREKISERMKILQDLVPGCSKVIGKALVLDEIINYVQSLQRQIELLSMKLEVINSRIDINPNSESLHPKDVLDTTGIIFGSQLAKEYVEVPQLNWLHMGGNFDRTI